MDPSIVSGLAALLGSVVGGSATIVTAWITQKNQRQHELVTAEVRKRETLYADFISESSKCIVDSVDHTLDHPEKLVQTYALLNRIRLAAAAPVVAAAENTIMDILKQYNGPKRKLETINPQTLPKMTDPLLAFSEACRKELQALRQDA